MTALFPSASAVQEFLGGFRSLGDRAQLLVGGKKVRHDCVAEQRGWNSSVWRPTVSRLSLNRVSVADRRPRNAATRLVHEECSTNRPSLASAGVGRWTSTMKARRGMRSMQNNRELEFHVSGLVKERPSSSAVTQCWKNGYSRAHPTSQAYWRRSKLSRQHQGCASGTKTGFQVSSKLSESLAVEFDGSRIFGSKNARASGDGQVEATTSLGRARAKFRASFARFAILSRFPDTKPEEQHEANGEEESMVSVASTSGPSDSVLSEDAQSVLVCGGGGKSGFISFYRPGSEQQEPETTIATSRSWRTIFWLLGPLVLSASVFLPPLYLRKIFGSVLSDSLMTDFVILIFTETLFFVGASVFLYIAHQYRTGDESVSTREQRRTTSLPFGYRVFAIVSLGIGLFLPVATFSMVWPWTGPAAAAALAPYMVGLLVQLSLEQVGRVKKTHVWPLVPITFQMYRLHQLNRAAQLISGLMFSLKGVEATAETMAISGSLQTLLFVLKILGVVCLGSLGAFLAHQLPTEPPASSSISSLP